MHTQSYHSFDRSVPRAIPKAVNVISGVKLSGTYSLNMISSAKLNELYRLNATNGVNSCEYLLNVISNE